LSVSEIEVPGLLGGERASQTLEYEGVYVPSVLISYTGAIPGIKFLNDYSSGAAVNIHSVDNSINKFTLVHHSFNVTPGLCLLLMLSFVLFFSLFFQYACFTFHLGIIVSPSHRRMSVMTGLCIYTANNNPAADPVKYRISGRLMSGANVKVRGQNDLCWSVTSEAILLGFTCSSSDLH